ncbi:MAG: hypothetical protein HC905_26810 [Bacteroidales bacterium]|nr:hypothetical protein [Bacteroidales bacterium]
MKAIVPSFKEYEGTNEAIISWFEVLEGTLAGFLPFNWSNNGTNKAIIS